MHLRQSLLPLLGSVVMTAFLAAEAADKNAWRKRSVYQYVAQPRV